jgi:hypothetical protein
MKKINKLGMLSFLLSFSVALFSMEGGWVEDEGFSIEAEVVPAGNPVQKALDCLQTIVSAIKYEQIVKTVRSVPIDQKLMIVQSFLDMYHEGFKRGLGKGRTQSLAVQCKKVMVECHSPAFAAQLERNIQAKATTHSATLKKLDGLRMCRKSDLPMRRAIAFNAVYDNLHSHFNENGEKVFPNKSIAQLYASYPAVCDAYSEMDNCFIRSCLARKNKKNAHTPLVAVVELTQKLPRAKDLLALAAFSYIAEGNVTQKSATMCVCDATIADTLLGSLDETREIAKRVFPHLFVEKPVEDESAASVVNVDSLGFVNAEGLMEFPDYSGYDTEGYEEEDARALAEFGNNEEL